MTKRMIFLALSISFSFVIIAEVSSFSFVKLFTKVKATDSATLTTRNIIDANSQSSDCNSMFLELEKWASDTGGLNAQRLYATGVRVKNSPDGNTASQKLNTISYWEANLSLNKKDHFFEGEGISLFNDRAQNRQPFNINQSDIQGVKIFSDGKFRFTLKSWGNYSSQLQCTCKNKMMYGFDNEGLFWVISFRKYLVPN